MASKASDGQTYSDEWETVSENRSRIVFDTVGDEWEGFYEGPEQITDPNTAEVYEYLDFRDSAGEGYMVSASYQLSRAFADMTPGAYVKLIVTGFTDTKRGKMTNFKVLRRNR